MHVLYHQHAQGAARELTDQRGEKFVWYPALRRVVSEFDPGRLRDVQERPERARREQALARAP